MKDIDFDELDKAVSSLISKGGASPSSAPASRPIVAQPAVEDAATSEPPVTLGPVQSPAKMDISEPIAPVAGPVSGATPSIGARPTTSPAIRRSGRFMDVVHPSSDMQTAPAPVVRPQSSKRPPLAPVSDDVRPDEVQSATLVTGDAPAAFPENEPSPFSAIEPSDSQKGPAVSESDTQSLPKAEAWPDPLDLAEKENVSTDDLASDASAQTAEQESSQTDSDQTKQPTAQSLSQTPFITDAKVEKRPLGSYGEDVGSDLGLLPKDRPEGSSMVSTSDFPAEYNADLVAIESKEPEIVPAPSESETEAVAPEPPLLAPQEDVSPAVNPVESPKAEFQPAVGGSIPPQYSLGEKKADEATHAVYDTQTYHQPLLASKNHHKTPAWIWVLLVIGLLVVGAGLGASLYFMGI